MIQEADPRDTVLRKAWARLDPSGNGHIDPSKLMQCFQGRAHPWVISGRLTAEELLTDFLNTCSVSQESSACCVCIVSMLTIKRVTGTGAPLSFFCRSEES